MCSIDQISTQPVTFQIPSAFCSWDNLSKHEAQLGIRVGQKSWFWQLWMVVGVITGLLWVSGDEQSGAVDLLGFWHTSLTEVHRRWSVKKQNILEGNGETGPGYHKDNSNSNQLLKQPETTNFCLNYPVRSWDRRRKICIPLQSVPDLYFKGEALGIRCKYASISKLVLTKPSNLLTFNRLFSFFIQFYRGGCLKSD